jgi:protein tyrosine phosphatase (PTP) superfamily phosphohydrolase (DUF442 family)
MAHALNKVPIITRLKVATGLVLATWLLTIGGAIASDGSDFQGTGRDARERGPAPHASAPAPDPIQDIGIENVYRLGPRLYSGGQPEGPAGFAALKALGIRTIVTVDGAAPDVETARALGLRYVHLPVGYDGIEREQAVRIIQATRTLPGPVFVHCHHGKHRGPTAAALCGLASENWSKDEAHSWLKRAGTSADYPGLFATVARFEMPTADELARAGTTFPERAETPPLTGQMVAIDERWDHLGAIRKAGFKPTARHADLDPPHEALQLVEQFRELARHAEAEGKGAEFRRLAEASARHAGALESALRQLGKAPSGTARMRAEEAFAAVSKSCTTCHARYRDNPHIR